MLQAPPEPKYVSTRKELGDLLGVEATTIAVWRSQGAPARGPQGWDVEAFRLWRSQHKAPAKVKKESDLGDSARLLKAQADEREAKAALANLQLKIECGDYMPRSEVKDRDLARIAVVRRGLLSLPRQAAPRVVGLTEKEVEVALTTVVRELLERFATL